jgi:hypothetical protein
MRGYCILLVSVAGVLAATQVSAGRTTPPVSAAVLRAAPTPTSTPTRTTKAHPPSTRLRLGGSVVRTDAAHRTITIVNNKTHQFYVLEVTSATKITLGGYPATYTDMLRGDHLIALGTLDAHGSSGATTAVIATAIRLNSTNFGGTITAISAPRHGSTALSVRGNRGHMLRVDATAQTLVYMTISGQKETAHATDLLVGEHIHASGKRTGKFQLTASTIHVYPHSHTVGGTLTGESAAGYAITAQDGSRYVIQPAKNARYVLNGKPSTAGMLKNGVHIRARGYFALHSSRPGIPTLIATYVSATVHQKTAARPTATKKAAGISL